MAQVLATNTVGTAATFQPFITPMVQRGSGSAGGHCQRGWHPGLPGHGAYCASKAASSVTAKACAGNCAAPAGSAPSARLHRHPLTRQNRYAMPFLMQPEDFADRAFSAEPGGATASSLADGRGRQTAAPAAQCGVRPVACWAPAQAPAKPETPTKKSPEGAFFMGGQGANSDQ